MYLSGTSWRKIATMDLYREGFLDKAGKGIIQNRLHSWRPRYFILDGKDLKYYKSKEITPENLLGTIHLAEIESVGLMKNETKCFQITINSPKTRTYYMKGRSEDEVMTWVRVIEMGKARQTNKTKTGSTRSENTLSMCSQVTPPMQSILDPSAPRNSNPIRSAYFLIGPAGTPLTGTLPLSPTTRTNSSSTSSSDSSTPMTPNTPIPSEYECINVLADNIPSNEGATAQASSAPDNTSFSDNEYDPTYEQVLHDQLSDAKPKGSAVEKQNSMKAPSKESDAEREDTPPTVPQQDPSLTLNEPYYQDISERKTETNGRLASDSESPTTLDSSPNDLAAAAAIYDQVVLQEHGASKDSEANNNNEAPSTTSGEIPEYAKPMRKKSSKRQMPGMIEIGEVSHEVEEDSAGGAESLRRGMTAPVGDKFAVEELRELLHKYDEEGTLHDGRKAPELADFHFNEEESAFDVLKRFLHQC